MEMQQTRVGLQSGSKGEAMNWKKLCLMAFSTAVLFSLPFVANAQDALPIGFLVHTLAIKTANGIGSSFLVNHKGKIYLVTAGHVVRGLASADTPVQVLKDGVWRPIHVVKVLHPPSAKVDIAVLKTELEAKPSEAIQLDDDDNEDVMMGQSVWFLGYPSADLLHSYFQGHKEMAFVKRGSMSAMDGKDPDAVILYIDGINNKGFSGGPILYFDLNKHEYRIIGVVEGYKFENAEELIGGKAVETKLLVNSGILVGYSIVHAIQAMEQDERKSTDANVP